MPPNTTNAGRFRPAVTKASPWSPLPFRLLPRWAAVGQFVGPPTGIGRAWFASGSTVLTLLERFVRSVNAHPVQLGWVVRVAIDSDGEIIIRPAPQA